MEQYYDTNVVNVDDLEIKIPNFIVIAAKSEAGKTVLLINILKNIIDKNAELFDNIILFSDTAKMTGSYYFLDNKYIYEFDKCEKIMTNIFNHQKKCKEKNNKDIRNIIVIFDDVNVTKKNNDVIKLATMGRHYNILTIMSLQNCKGLLAPSVRGNVKLILFNDLNYEGEDAVYKTIHIPFKFNEFHNFIDKYNENYQFICYDNKEHEKQKRIKVVRAKMYNKLKFI